MGLLSSFLDKHYPHEEMIKQRKKQKGISASSSSELLPLKSILEVLLNKSMRPDPYVIIDDQVRPPAALALLPARSSTAPMLGRAVAEHCFDTAAVVGWLRGAVDQGRCGREGYWRQQQVK